MTRVHISEAPEERERRRRVVERTTVRTSPLWQAVKGKSVAEIEAWVDANLTTPEAMRRALALVIAYLVHERRGNG